MAGSYHLIDLSSSDDVIYISDEEGNLSKYVEHDYESVDDETSIREPSTGFPREISFSDQSNLDKFKRAQ
jgi:hypothetical protein